MALHSSRRGLSLVEAVWKKTYRVKIAFTVRIPPKAKSRHRTAGGRAYTDKSQVSWEQAFGLFAYQELQKGGGLFDKPLDEPVALVVHFVLPRPKRLCRKKDPEGQVPHMSKPDLDNLVKSVMDSLNQISLWSDDKIVTQIWASKAYAEKEGTPRIECEIRTLEEDNGFNDS
jgi:Holliday junction resolvase RusA-like endonuclease